MESLDACSQNSWRSDKSRVYDRVKLYIKCEPHCQIVPCFFLISSDLLHCWVSSLVNFSLLSTSKLNWILIYFPNIEYEVHEVEEWCPSSCFAMKKSPNFCFIELTSNPAQNSKNSWIASYNVYLCLDLVKLAIF